MALLREHIVLLREYRDLLLHCFVSARHVCRALLRGSIVLLREYRALLRGFIVLLREYVVLLREHRALLKEYKVFWRECRALLFHRFDNLFSDTIVQNFVSVHDLYFSF